MTRGSHHLDPNRLQRVSYQESGNNIFGKIIKRLKGVCGKAMTCKDCKYATHDQFRLDYPYGCEKKLWQRMTEAGYQSERVCGEYKRKEYI